MIRYNARKKSPQHVELYDYNSYDDAVMLGTRGSGKTWDVSNLISLRTCMYPRMRTLLLRDVAGQINQSILYSIKNRLQYVSERANMSHCFEFQERQVASRDPSLASNVLITSKGFRKSQTVQESDLKGFEDFDNFVLEEVQDVVDKSRIDTLRATARKEGRKMYMMSNAVNAEHWLINRYFDLVQSEQYEDYLVPIAKQIDRTYIKVSSYKENIHLDKRTRAEYDAYGDPESYLYDIDTYCKDFLCLIPKSGRLSVFSVDKIKMGERVGRNVDGLTIYQEPVRGRQYAIGVDNSSGLSTDYCALHVIDILTGEQVATAKLKMQEQEWALFISRVGRLYNQAFLAIERNEAGRVIIRIIIEDYQYPIDRMFTHDTRITQSTKFGFATTLATRPVMITELGVALKNEAITINCDKTYQELCDFHYIDGKAQAKIGSNDDLVMSLGIAWACVQYARNFMIS